MKKVAITGGLACGKSSVCHFLEQLGAYVVSADRIVHDLLSPSSPVGKRVIALLGENIVKGEIIDRAFVAREVFEDLPRLKALETLLHPEVDAAIEAEYRKQAALGQYQLFVAEMPLLYEAQLHDGFDAIVAVMSDERLCVERYVRAGRGDFCAFRKRAQLQLEPAEKAGRADYVIVNDGSLDDLFQETRAVVDRLLAD